MQRGPKNLKQALFPHFATYAIIGHGIFRDTSGRQFRVFSVIYAIVTMALYLVALFATVTVFIPDEAWYGQYDTIFFCIVYVTVVIYIFGMCLSWSHAKRFARIADDLTKIDGTLRDLGMTFDYAKIRNEGYVVLVCWIIITTGFNWFDTYWYYDAASQIRMFILFMVLHYPAHAMTMAGTSFCVEIRLIDARYSKVNAILEGMKRRCTYDNSCKKLSSRTRHLMRTPDDRKLLIQALKHLHLELGAISKDLCDSYGMQLALHIGCLFVMFTGLLYVLFNLVWNSTVSKDGHRMLALAVWILVYFAYFILTNEICDRACVEANRTGEIIHCICKENSDPELSYEISQFSLQLIHEPLEFCPAGLITLNHVFVLRFVETVITYLMILIQMGPPKAAIVPDH